MAKKSTIVFQVEGDMRRALDKRARRERRSLGALLRLLLERAMKGTR